MRYNEILVSDTCDRCDHIPFNLYCHFFLKGERFQVVKQQGWHLLVVRALHQAQHELSKSGCNHC